MASALSNYPALLKKVQDTLLLGQRRIEWEKIQTYHETGKIINTYILKDERAEYGSQVVAKLAEDLGVSKTLLIRCIQFAEWPIDAAQHQFGKDFLTWSHFVELVKIPDNKIRFDFAKRAVKGEWTYRELARKIQQEAPTARFRAMTGRLDTIAGQSLVLPSTVPGRGGDRPMKKLVPQLGKPYTYRLGAMESVTADEDDKSLWLDLGFSTWRRASKNSAKGFKDGEIVESLKKEELYIIKKSERKETDLFTYYAKVERVVDGDTLRVIVDLGFGMSVKQYLRLRGIDAPEMDTDEGKEAKKFVEKELSKVDHILIRSTRDDKYGRYLADVFLPNGRFLNQVLLDTGHAVPY